MILSLYVVIVAISLVLIWLGFYNYEHSELALIGFVFLFLLSFQLISGSLQYQAGTNTTIIYDNLGNRTIETAMPVYNNFNDANSHRFGYYLAVGSFVSFIGVIVALGRRKE